MNNTSISGRARSELCTLPQTYVGDVTRGRIRESAYHLCLARLDCKLRVSIAGYKSILKLKIISICEEVPDEHSAFVTEG